MTNSLPAHPVWIAALALGLALAAVTADATPRERQQTRTRAAAPEGVPYAGREDVLRFAAEVAERRGWDRSWVEQQLAGARKLPVVQRLIMPPPAGTAKNWAAYRARFIEPSRINAGLRFWQAHESWLSQAEARYGVPAEIVVGIIGVETFYGRIMGNFRVLDALATLTFDFPTGRRDRSALFRGELEELLALAHRGGTDLTTLRGSFAGALGLPQFLPGSLNKYGVDFDGDGRVDLIRSEADVVGSVANYLAQFGWQRGQPTHYPVAVPVEVSDRALLLAPDILPSFTAAQFAERGAELGGAGRSHDGLLALVELQNGDAAPSYVAGTQNFYAVTRYNWSSYYALAVIELGAEIARARRAR
jgi:membrane-bound lytic murein transglycosylase B